MLDWSAGKMLARFINLTQFLVLILWAPCVYAFNEVPFFSKTVNSGDLPSVEKRLPPTPVIVKPIDHTGNHGGNWRRAYTGMSDLVGVRRILYEPLVRWNPEFEVEPNLAESWEVDDTGRVYTFHLVKGVRWSDGEPFTADDVMFYFDDILFDKELTVTIPNWLSPDGARPTVEKIDDYTFRIEFAKPYSIFLKQLACPHGMELVTKPKHYLKNFHKK